jgi:mRNA interferase MazF
VKISKGDGGVRNNSAILCEAIRPISKERLISKWGTLSSRATAEVEDRIRILLGL